MAHGRFMPKDARGQKFGLLTVLENAGRAKNGMALWLCRCECGRETTVKGVLLRGGATRSCGCLVGRKKTHGHTNSPTYSSWCAMWKRVTNVNHPAYKNYGGRGITITTRWSDFKNFLEDMGERPGL